MTRAVIPVHILIPSSGIVTLKSPITNVGLAVVGVVVAGCVVDDGSVGLLEAIVGLDVDVVVGYLLGLAYGFAVGVDVVIDLPGLAVRVNFVDNLLGLAVGGVFVVGVG